MRSADLPVLNKRSRGQALVMVTMGIVFLLGLLGLVVDVGYGYYMKQVVQATADSAATAAAMAAKDAGGTCGATVLCQTGYTCPSSPSNADNFGIACLYAATNGLTGQQVTVSSGTGTPPTASGVTTNYWVSVTATVPQHLGFLSVLGVRDATVSSQATGAVVSTGATSGCIYVMDPALSASYSIVGTASVTANCGIFVNSSASDAFTAKGSSTTTASVIDVVGHSSINNNASVTPTPTTGQSAVSDPLSTLPAPTYSGCNHTNFSSSGGLINFSPGVYCGGISITGQAQLNFAPGTYILNGGGLYSTSNNTTINGTGVFFYNTSNGYAYGPMSLAGGTSITLSGPTSGTYQGILWFQDRHVTSSAINSYVGGAASSVSGTIYMPTGDLYFKGNTTTAQSMALIVKTLSAVGTSVFQKDTTGSLTGLGKTSSYLVQ